MSPNALENRWACKRPVGSNPTPAASVQRATPVKDAANDDAGQRRRTLVAAGSEWRKVPAIFVARHSPSVQAAAVMRSRTSVVPETAVTASRTRARLNTKTPGRVPQASHVLSLRPSAKPPRTTARNYR